MKLRNGLIYFYIHLAIEVASFFVLTKFVSHELAFLLSLIYDYLAFVPQGLFGFILDRKFKYPALVIGTLMCALAVGLVYLPLTPFVAISIVGIGNALVHISGAERTLRESNGKMTPSALFVGGGSFGLILGKICANYNVPIWIVILVTLSILIPYLYLRKHPIDYEKPIEGFKYSNIKINPVLVVILAVIVVAFRAFVGYGIPTTWNQALWQTILLYCFMGLGKCLGGILIDLIGIKWTILISTVLATPFLIFGDNIMILSIIGVMFFSMTMAITLAIITSNMKEYPGLAFGMTTVGLFIGTVPIFFFQINDLTINIIVIIISTVLSLIILLIISKGSFKVISQKEE